MLLHTLPRLRSYDPWWNAGTADPSAALSGAASTLALFWPVLWLGPLERVYPAIVALVSAGLVPWCLFAATRLLGGSALAAFLAGILALAPDETYFFWFMAHGTLPAAISAALATLTIALAWRVFVRHDRRWWLALVLAWSLAIGLFWALFALMVGPALLVGALVHWRRLRRRELGLGLGIAAALFVVHAHWLVGIAGAVRAPYTASGPIGGIPWAHFLWISLATIPRDPSPLALVLGGAGSSFSPPAPGPVRELRRLAPPDGDARPAPLPAARARALLRPALAGADPAGRLADRAAPPRRGAARGEDGGGPGPPGARAPRRARGRRPAAVLGGYAARREPDGVRVGGDTAAGPVAPRGPSGPTGLIWRRAHPPVGGSRRSGTPRGRLPGVPPAAHRARPGREPPELQGRRPRLWTL